MTDDDVLREFAKRVFTRCHDPAPESQPAPEPDPATNNVVPTEGGNPPPDEGDRSMREYARALFDRDI